MPTQIYLGDGLYGSFDGYQITLETERFDDSGRGVVHYVCVEPEVLNAFLAYAAKCFNLSIKVEDKRQGKLPPGEPGVGEVGGVNPIFLPGNFCGLGLTQQQELAVAERAFDVLKARGTVLYGHVGKIPGNDGDLMFVVGTSQCDSDSIIGLMVGVADLRAGGLDAQVLQGKTAATKAAEKREVHEEEVQGSCNQEAPVLSGQEKQQKV